MDNTGSGSPVWPASGFTESLPFTFPSFLLRYSSRGLSKERSAAVPPVRCTTREPVIECAPPNFLGVRIMFKIIKYRNHSGKIQMTIETDDQMAADFCRFFGTINKFVDLFNYRVRSAKSFDLLPKNSSPQIGTPEKGIRRAAGTILEDAGHPY